MAREDPIVAFRFALEIEGKLSGYFTNVSGIGSDSELVEEKIVDSETGETLTRYVPGRTIWTPITLRRGVTSNIDVWKWRKDVVDGKIADARTNCSIIALSRDNKPVARWNFVNAWPKTVTGPEMDSGGAEFMVEEMTIIHEGAERES
jgi:phage tail-like protein